MKTFHLKKVIPLFTAVLIFSISCQKSNNNSTSTSPGTETAAQKAMLLSATNDVFMSSNASDEDLSDGVQGIISPDSVMMPCRKVTYIPSATVYPHQTIIDFGNGCLGPDGVTRKGKKIVTNFANPNTSAPGTELSVTTFSNFFEDSIAVQGEIKIYEKATASPGPFVLEYIDNLTYTSSNGSVKSAYGTHEWTQISGAITGTRSDDVFSITGTTNGTEVLDGATDLTFTSVVDALHPEIKPVSCYFRTQGGENVTIHLITGGASTFDEYLDYGTGACDNVATLSINGGTAVQITLPLQFWPLSLY